MVDMAAALWLRHESTTRWAQAAAPSEISVEDCADADVMRLPSGPTSQYVSPQWNVASFQPPHLTTIMPWAGYGDAYHEGPRVYCSMSRTTLQNRPPEERAHRGPGLP